MGTALVEGSDIAIFTSDNPRSENPKTILLQMVGSLKIAPPHTVISDRRDAISQAIDFASGGDVVVVMGKGHETGQEISGVVLPFDDRLILASAIEGKA
jgi:UDP-N-acetylmuramoyl-L-alanyl-D-glutamate--2,6-diaminopimelate ligase